jgi:hypothetical protein
MLFTGGTGGQEAGVLRFESLRNLEGDSSEAELWVIKRALGGLALTAGRQAAYFLRNAEDRAESLD